MIVDALALLVDLATRASKRNMLKNMTILAGRLDPLHKTMRKPMRSARTTTDEEYTRLNQESRKAGKEYTDICAQLITLRTRCSERGIQLPRLLADKIEYHCGKKFN